jgi:hypothetical protein
LLVKYNSIEQVKKDEISRACSMNRGEEECILVKDTGGKVRRKVAVEKTKT